MQNQLLHPDYLNNISITLNSGGMNYMITDNFVQKYLNKIQL